jgi:hypothetical protein
VLTALLELEAGSGHQVSHGGRHEDLAGSCLRHYASPCVDRDPADSRSIEFDLSCMHTDTHLEAKRPHSLLDREPAPDGASRAIEYRQKAVASIVDLASPKPSKERPHALVVRRNEISPGAIAHRYGSLGRADEVGKEDGCQHAIDLHFVSVDGDEKAFKRSEHLLCLISCKDEVVVARELDEAGTGDVCG